MNYQLSSNCVELCEDIQSEIQPKDINALNTFFDQKSITDTLNDNGVKVNATLISTNESQYLLKSLFELQKHTNDLEQINGSLAISDEMLKCYSDFSEKFTEFGKSIESTYSNDATIEFLAKDDLHLMNKVKDIAVDSLTPFANAKSNFGQLNLRDDFQNKASLAVSGIESRINGSSFSQAPEINKSNTFSLGSVER